MSDRTPIEVVIYSCPPERVEDVLAVFGEFDLGREFILPGDRDGSRRAGLELGRGYVRDEVPVGSSAEIAAALPPDAAWKVWEDPKYEHLGEVHLNHPDLGVFVSDCDAQGCPVFTSVEVHALVELAGGDRVEIGHQTGRTWEIALEQLDAANNGIVIPRDALRASGPLQAVALNQLASGPSRWMPTDAPGQARSTAAPDR